MALLRSLNISFTNSPVLAEKRKSRPNRKTTAMSDVEEETIMQAEFLAKDIVECLLNASSISVNGYTDVPTGTLKDVSDQHSCIRNNQAFLRARENIIAGCTYMQQQHGREIERMCTRFEVDDVQLNTNFEEVLATIWTEPRNWGRLISLFVATYYICKRLDQENDKDKIQSVIGWLGSFLKTNAVTWVVEHGGFVSLPKVIAESQA